MTGESPHRKMTDRERTLVGRRRLMQGSTPQAERDAKAGIRGLGDRERALLSDERLSQGTVKALRDQVVDSDGRIGAPLIALSTLAVMERHGTITREQRVAGERFHDLFRRASLDGLKAAAMDRVSAPYIGAERLNGNERAKREIAEVMRHLKDPSILASCAWHVLGLEWTLTQWAAKATRGNTHQASGVTIATLAVLDAYFG